MKKLKISKIRKAPILTENEIIFCRFLERFDSVQLCQIPRTEICDYLGWSKYKLNRILGSLKKREFIHVYKDSEGTPTIEFDHRIY